MARLMVPLAKESDVAKMEQSIGKHIAGVSERVDTVKDRADKLETDMRNMRIELEEMRREMGRDRRDIPASGSRRRSSVGAENSAWPPQTQDHHASSTWVRRVVHFRGWAPWGCDPGQKLDRAAAVELQKRLFRMLPMQWQPRVRWLTPFMRKHTTSCEVLMATEGNAKQVSDAANMALARTPVRINGMEVRAA